MYSNFSNRMPSDKKFGITFSILIFFLSIYFYFKQIDIFLYLLLFSILFFLVSIIKPAYLKRLKKLWMSLGIVLGFFISHIVMFIIYYLAFVTTGLILKLFRKDILDIKIDKNLKSYWKKRQNSNQSMENQF